MQFPDKVSALLSVRGLSQRALAAELGVSNGTVAGWVRGARPHPGAARQLADHFGVTVDDLLDDGRELPPEVLPRRRPAAVTYPEAADRVALVEEAQSRLPLRRRSGMPDTMIGLEGGTDAVLGKLLVETADLQVTLARAVADGCQITPELIARLEAHRDQVHRSITTLVQRAN